MIQPSGLDTSERASNPTTPPAADGGPSERSSSRPGLVGRESELARLEQFLSTAADGGRTLSLVGEAGIGKSSLLAEAAACGADLGMRVIRTTGVETESHVPFAGLDQLLRPVLVPHCDSLSSRHRDALRSVFGPSDQTVAEAFAIGLATLELFIAVASSCPVLLVIDDAQWIDWPTTDALAVMARRIGGSPIWFLTASREGYESPLHDACDDELRVNRLDEAHSRTLLDTLAPHLNDVTRGRVLDLSVGNPLALAELSRDNSDTWTDPLSVTKRIERTFAGRLNDMPSRTRTLVLAAAINDGESLSEVIDAAEMLCSSPVSLRDMEPAISARLITIRDNRIVFHHPLVRSAVRWFAPLDERISTHAALATVLDDNPDRAVWHRAAATIRPDDNLADDLEAAARRLLHRSGTAAAQSALERAAQLTTNPHRRSDRALWSAQLAFDLGRRDIVERLLHDSESIDQRPTSRARALLIRERFEDELGTSPVGIGALATAAAASHRDGDSTLALQLLAAAAIRCWWTDAGGEERQSVLQAADSIDVDATEPQMVASLGWAGTAERGNDIIERLAPIGISVESDPTGLRLLGGAAICVGDHILACRFLDAAVDGLRRNGRIASLAQVLALRAWNSVHATRLEAALLDAEEAERLARESGQHLWAARAQAAHAAVVGLRGDVHAADELTGTAERSIFLIGANAAVVEVQLARGMTALSERSYQEAYEQLKRMFDPSDRAYHSIKRCWSVGDLAEAAVHSGHRDAALSVVAEIRVRFEGTTSPHVLSALRHATALLADDVTAESRYREALAAASPDLPFERARLELAYAAWLRRRRRNSDSRTLLRSARATFDALGATGWARQASDELRASGETVRHSGRSPAVELTPQELQIANLAAQGLPNRDIGARLFLSPRTVGSHLYRIFPKLGVTSRTQLASALDTRGLRDESTSRLLER